MRAILRFKWPIILCLLGAALTAWQIAVIISSYTRPSISVLVPGEARFEIKEPGRYTLWSQVEASFEGKLMTFPTGLPAGVTIRITREADGAIVPLHSKWPVTHREFGDGYIQVAIGRVTFDAPGFYQIATDGLREKRAFHLDRLNFETLFMKAAIGSVGPLLFFVGFVWGIVLFVSHRAKQA